MNEVMKALCEKYENPAPVQVGAAAMDVADQASEQLQIIRDTVLPGAEQSAQVKEILNTVAQVKKNLMNKVQQFHDELNPNVLSTFHDLCSEQTSAIHGMMHIVGNKVEELFSHDEELALLAEEAKKDGDSDVFPFRMVHEGNQYTVEMTHIHDGKAVNGTVIPEKEIKSYRYHIIQKDGKYIVEQG